MNERLTIHKGGLLQYRYNVGPDLGFAFHTLAEVGAPYQAWFREEIQERGLVVEFGRNLDERPYVADFVITKTSPAQPA